ncbi:MAG TPA: elongation factor P maturation arginine rhamnosyltransferase EarP [Usitatibacter sp.]|nr:elongation factor P maturation arginine rhamnosyltransferase EarP [Usitatibacter sp.]
MAATESWDIFCRVVDNFGDVGVSWRLARSIAREHGKRVRLFIDDLTVLAKLRPEIDTANDIQRLEGVEIVRIREPFDSLDVADAVVETFGCDPPQAYVAAMASRTPRPRWINLEYLSAEDWVEASHALPSPHPRLPLVKHFFFPGFTAKTGGLLREASLIRRRDEFQADPGAQAAFWRSIVGEAPPPETLKVSLFSYAGAPVEGLARCAAQRGGDTWLVAPEGYAATALAAWRLDARARESIRCFTISFLAQDRYDQLLWASDVNFVRGEDSFVRAQWAARPFVWHVYPQDEGAHWVKLSAFLARYTAGLERLHAAAFTSMWDAWNRGDEPGSAESVRPALGEAWAGFVARREVFGAHGKAWSHALATRGDLAAELADFVDNVL